MKEYRFNNHNLPDVDQYIQVFRGMRLCNICEQLAINCSSEDVLVFHGGDYSLIVTYHGNRYTKNPSLAQKVKNLIGTANDIAKTYISKHKIIASDIIIKVRQDACSKCQYHDEKKWCRICGCVTEYKTKLLASKCPEGYW